MGSGPSIPSPVACNGNAALCSRSYSNVVQIGTHGSPFVGILPTHNQQVSLAGQLNAGIRFLQGQTHVKDGVLYMCHTSCDLEEAGKLTDYLGTIKTWMDKNQGQVITILLTNGDRVDVNMFKNDFESSGMSSYAYTPSKKLVMDEWPTLQSLINDGKRAVVFLGILRSLSNRNLN